MTVEITHAHVKCFGASASCACSRGEQRMCMMRAARAYIDVWFTTCNAQSLHFIKPALYLVPYVRSFHASKTIIWFVPDRCSVDGYPHVTPIRATNWRMPILHYARVATIHVEVDTSRVSVICHGAPYKLALVCTSCPQRTSHFNAMKCMLVQFMLITLKYTLNTLPWSSRELRNESCIF